LLDDLERSGQTVAAFARERGIPAHKLYWARRRRSQAAQTVARLSFDEVRLVGDDDRADTTLEVRLPSGMSLHLARDFDGVTLRRLLGVLANC
jgi:hypothetical protein